MAFHNEQHRRLASLFVTSTVKWLDETKEWLSPALAPDADFWNGWSAVRYLNDQFDRQYQRQLAFVKAILPLVSPADGFVLRTKTAELEMVRRTLDRLGRQQGMSKIVAAASSHFLELLEDWFGELQGVTGGSPGLTFRLRLGRL
jgi:hypothetical protein